MERAFASLPAGPLLLKCVFKGQLGDKEGSGKRARLTFEDAAPGRRAISPVVSCNARYEISMITREARQDEILADS
jgi:hypothetical protein